MSYCTQNNWDCDACSLGSYGRDCHNNPVIAAGPCDNCGSNADDCHCGDYIDTSPLSEAQKARISDKDPTQAEIDAFFGVGDE